MSIDDQSQQASQIVDHQLHRLSVYKEVLCAIHDQRLLQCQRIEGKHHAPEKGAQSTLDTSQSDSLHSQDSRPIG